MKIENSKPYIFGESYKSYLLEQSMQAYKENLAGELMFLNQIKWILLISSNYTFTLKSPLNFCERKTVTQTIIEPNFIQV